MTYADGNYIQYACVLLLSLKDVISTSREYYIFIFYSNCREEDLQKLILTLKENLPSNIYYETIQCKYQLESKLRAKEKQLSATIYNKILIYNQPPLSWKRFCFSTPTLSY